MKHCRSNICIIHILGYPFLTSDSNGLTFASIGPREWEGGGGILGGEGGGREPFHGLVSSFPQRIETMGNMNRKIP